MSDKKSILLRITPELWEQLNRWARDDLRSVNAQIEFVLREAVRRREHGSAERDSHKDDPTRDAAANALAPDAG